MISLKRFVVRGHLANFARGESTDRFSYPFITPSAACGIVEAIYTHNRLLPVIRRISVLNMIRYLRLGHTHRDSITRASKKGVATPPGDVRRLTSEGTLVDQSWLIEFEWREVEGAVAPHASQHRGRMLGMGPKAVGPQRPVDFAKAIAIFTRRIERGEFYYPPMLGLQGYRAVFHAPTGKEKPIAQSRDFGMVLHGFDYRVRPVVAHTFHAKMVDGVIEVPSFYDTVLCDRKQVA